MITAIAACGTINKSLKIPTHKSESKNSAVNTPISTTTTTKTLKVVPPSKRHGPQLGIDVLWYDNNETISTINQEANQTLNYIVGLGANAISISFPFYDIGGLTGSKVSAGQYTPSPTSLGFVIKSAENRGLQVSLRPLMDEANLSPGWRGVIKPANITTWFASYNSFLKPYLQLAQETQVSAFIIGAELSSIQSLPQWQTTIEQARGIYNGTIGYSDNYDKYASNSFGPNVSQIGLDAYFPIQVNYRANITAITSAWNAYLSHVNQQVLSSTVIDEVGIAAQQGAFSAPYQTSFNTPIDVQVQSNWFAAACQFFRQHKMAGIYYWSVDLNNNPSTAKPTNDSPTSFIGRGDTAIKQCFNHG